MKRAGYLGAVALLGAAIVWWVVGAGRLGAMAQSDGNDWPRPDVRVESLREHLRFLASDELGGRAAGTAGFDSAAALVERELVSYGVAPLFPGVGDTTSFRQPFVMASWEVGPQGTMTISGNGDPVELALLADLQVAYVSPDAEWDRDWPVVYVGAGLVEPDLGYDDLAGLDLEGACAAILFDPPAAVMSAGPPELRARNPQGNQGLIRRIGHVAQRGAGCVITLPGMRPPGFWTQFLRDPSQLSSRNATPSTGGAFVDLGVALSHRGTAALFRGQAGNPDVDDTLKPFALAGVTVGFDLELRSAGRHETANVGGLIPGTDPALAGEVIVFTAHLDGQGTQADGTILNSANDNAASVVALLEAARNLAAAPARRPVALVFTSAEEMGLAGAEHFVNNPPVAFSNIALNVNMEMVGKRRRPFGSYQFRVAGRHSDAIETLVEATRRRHGGVDFDYERRFETPDYQFRRADHAHFFLRGVPTIYFYGGGADYHQPSDDADGVEYEKVRTMAEVLVELIRVSDTMDSLPTSDGRS